MKPFSTLSAALLCGVVALIPARAQFTWSPTPTSSGFESDANWTLGVAPTPGSNLVFSSSSVSGIVLSANFNAGSLTFNGTYPAYSFSTGSGSTVGVGSGGLAVGSGGGVTFASGLGLLLTDSQTWNVAGNLTVAGSISGSSTTITKTGAGTLTLSGASIFNGGLTVSAGTLLLGSSSHVIYDVDPWDITDGPFGIGTLTLAGGTTLAPVSGSGIITLHNLILLSGNAAIGQAGSTDQIRIDTKPGLTSGIRATSPGQTLTVKGGILTLAADPTAETAAYNNLGTIAVDSGAALVFAFQSALPTTAVTAATGSYVGVANGVLNGVPVGFLASADALIAKLNPSAFAGTFGFDSEDLMAPATFTGTLNFSGFTNATFGGLSTLSTAIIGSGATLSAPTSGAFAFTALNAGTLRIDAALLASKNFTNGIVIGRDDGRSDTGTVVLTNGSNNFTGGTTLKSGTLVVRSANALGAGTITATNAATAPPDSSAAPKLTTTLSGSGSLGLTLANNLVVNTSYAAGAYGLGIGGVDSFTLSGTITGTGVIDKYGAGNLTLTGDATGFTGKFTVASGGTLQIGNGGATGAISANVANSGTLAFNRSTDLGYGGVISGSGAVTKSGAGTLTLTGANTYSGNTTVNSGTLKLGAAGALPSGTGKGDVTVNSSGTLDLNGLSYTVNGLSGGGTVTSNAAGALTFGVGADDSGGTFSGSILNGAGTLSLLKVGNGLIKLTGTNTYSGTTTINAGTLQIGSGGTSGSIGTANIANNATLRFNRSDAVTIANVIDGTGQFVQAGPGVLTLAGTNTYTGNTTVSAGTLKLGSATALPTGAGKGDVVVNGTLDLNGLSYTVNGLSGSSSGIIFSGTGGALTFGVGDDNSGGTFSGSVQNGLGTLSLLKTGTNTITLSGANTYSGTTTVNAGTLQIGSGGTGGTLGGGNVTNNAILKLNRSNTLTIANAIDGTGSLVQAGSGTAVLTGTNTYSGTTTVSAGTLQIGDGGTVGTLGPGNVTDNATLSFNRSDAVTVANVIGGTGSLVQAGTGTLKLTGANTYAGNTTVSAGTLIIGAAGVLPSGTGKGNLIVNGTGLLDLNGLSYTVNGLSGSGTVDSIVGGTLTFTVGANNAGGTFSGVIKNSAGTLSLLKTGSGTIVLSGANTFAGTTTVSAGTLQIGAGGTTGNLGPGNVTNNATLNFNRSDSLTVANAISGTGNLVQAGSGTTVLTAANTYAGTTTVSAGTLQIGAGGTVGTLGAGGVTNNATLGFNRSDAVTVANVIGGTGNLVQAGSGTLTLTGANTYAGNTTVSAGTLKLGAAGVVPSGTGKGNVIVNGTLDLNGLNQTVNGLSGSGTVDSLGGGALTFTVGANDAGGTFSGVIKNSTGILSLLKTGSDTIVLSGANTFSGITTVSAGTLQIGAGGTSGALPGGNITNNATLSFKRSDAVTVANAIGGSGNLEQAGTGTLTLTGANAFAGTTTVSAGTLRIGVANALPTTTKLSLAAGSLLDVDYNQTIAGFFGASGAGATIDVATSTTFGVALAVAATATDFAGAVTGNGTFAVTGAGGNTVTLNGPVAGTVATTVGSGTTLVIGSGGSISGPVAITGTLSFTNPSSQTLGGILSGTGGLNVSAGTVTLATNNTFSGPATVTGGKLLVTGTNTGGGSLTVGTGGTFGGTGSFSGPLVLNSGGTVAPGASPGTLGVGPTTFAGGAGFNFEINNSAGTAGSQWDLLSISGALTITATPANPFVVNLTSLTLSNTAGLLAGFNAASPYSWKFVETTGGITGFSAGAFQYNAGSFQNNLNGGSFFVSKIGNDLFLNFTPVPEPSTYALLALGLGTVALVARRRRR